MQRNDYLNPEDIKRQCIRAAGRLEEDSQALKTIEKSIDAFAGDSKISSEAFDALKRQLEDYHIIIEAMQIAGSADAADFRSLSCSVGSEILDGGTIYGQMENALRMKESYQVYSKMHREKMKMTENAFLIVYYDWKARQYESLAENSQRLYEEWNKKARKYDEIDRKTSGLFTGSENMILLIQKGQEAMAVGSLDRDLRRQIMNAGIRLSMGYDDRGGDQNGPYTLWKRGVDSDRDTVRKLIHRYEEYADYSDQEIEELLMKLNSEGCGYVAFANIIVDEYRMREEEFEEIFGFPLFLENVNGDTYVNYNQLIIDLYCASDNHKKVKHVWKEYDIYDADEDFSAVNGWGTTPEDRIYRFERYMDGHGVAVKLENIECDSQEVYQKCMEETELGNKIIISTCPVRLEDEKGEIAQMDGGHAMTVTGLTDDGRIEVSSWGEKYYIQPEDPDYTDPESSSFPDAYIRIQSVRFEEVD